MKAKRVRSYIGLLGLSFFLACGDGTILFSNQASNEAIMTARTELQDGVLVMRTDLPASTEDCSQALATPCLDQDEDGLADVWEEMVLEKFSPMLELDENEPMLKRKDAQFGYMARVFRLDPQKPMVRIFLITAYSSDDGACDTFLTSHKGDSERVALELEILDNKADAIMRRVFLSCHEYTPNDNSPLYEGAELVEQLRFVDEDNGEPRWLIYSSKSKHANFANKENCETLHSLPCLKETCAADGVDNIDDYRVLPTCVNAGEPNLHLIDDLAEIGFPNEKLWVDQWFCGGLGRERFPLFEHIFCAEPLVQKLLRDPFEERK